MLKITRVQPGSVGEEIGLTSGDSILFFNGIRACDVLDYLYYDSECAFTMTVKMAGVEIDYDIEKDEDETLGLEFAGEGGLEPIRCKNHCKFCFVSQLPKGMRKSLYVKDDDWRLSLISGNFVTLTNLTDADLDRIIHMRMSPLYLSVHSMRPETRISLMGNPRSGDLARMMQKLGSHGIGMHCQIVLCPGYNDGDDLTYTLAKLAEIPSVLSVAIVPVGLTGHREGLAPLVGLGEKDAADCIREAEKANRLRSQRFIFCSDEMYFIAKMPLLGYNEYGDFSQIENGVGLIRKFEREFDEVVIPRFCIAHEATLVTGVSAYPFLCQIAEKFNARAGTRLHVVAIENEFFGPSITVAGLVTGQDLIRQLTGKKLGEFIVIPRVMLREFGTVFLDDVSVEDVAKSLGVPVRVAEVTGEGLVKAVLNKE